MTRPVSLSHVVRWLDKRAPETVLPSGQDTKRAGFFLAVSLFLIIILFSACANPFGSSSASTVRPTSSTQKVSQIKWCSQVLMVFRDEGDFTLTPQTATPSPTTPAKATGTPVARPGTPQTLTNWSVVKANLGFTVYLPSTVPSGTCLVSVQATIHDPIFGGSFTIGYLLPDNTSLSLSEAPLKSQNTMFQCSGAGTPTPRPTPGSKTGSPAAATPSPTTVPTQLCSGAKNTTNIILSGPGTVDQLQQIFTNLQPDVNWIPAS